MSSPNANYNYYAAVTGQSGSAGVYSSSVNQYQRNGTDTPGETDGPAVVCKFFSQGWCIKGNSCSFLHVKDRKSVSTDFRHSVGYKTEMPSYSWEPSTPFQPSFELTRRLLSSVNQFDSMLESKPGEVHSQNDLFPVETGPNESKPGEVHSQNDLFPVETGPNTEHDCATQSDAQKSESVDMAGREADVKIGEIIARDPEYLKMYRGIFKDYVKELIKPTWREGKLSKNAHIMIVKRTVDKIMDIVKPLRASELADPFDDSMKQRIANFVEYYTDKYGNL